MSHVKYVEYIPLNPPCLLTELVLEETVARLYTPPEVYLQVSKEQAYARNLRLLANAWVAALEYESE